MLYVVASLILTTHVVLAASYNKTEEDFDTLDEYNDYLETLENLSTWPRLPAWTCIYSTFDH
jgi:hypothetical protein